MAQQEPEPSVDSYQPIPKRRRWLILVLAISTAITIVWMMLERIGAPPLRRIATPDAAAPCAAGQSTGCVGGTASVIMVAPPASAASR
jgi:hypothetical protein